MLLKSGCLQYVVGVIEQITTKAKNNGGSTTGLDRSLLVCALQSLDIIATSNVSKEQVVKQMTGLNVSSILVETMKAHARTDRELTSLAASTLARISAEGDTSLTMTQVGHVDARVCTHLLQNLDALLDSGKGNTMDLLDVLGSDLLTQTSSIQDQNYAPVVADMLKNVMAQRMAEDLATEEGIQLLVSEIESGTDSKRTAAAVKVLRRIVGREKNKDGKGGRSHINQHLINLKVGAKVARALASSQSDEFRQDALHFLQSLSSNREVGFADQGLDLADLVLISEQIKQGRNEEGGGSEGTGEGNGVHAQLLQSIEIMMENHLDRPPPSHELFATLHTAIDVVEAANERHAVTHGHLKDGSDAATPFSHEFIVHLSDVMGRT